MTHKLSKIGKNNVHSSHKPDIPQNTAAIIRLSSCLNLIVQTETTWLDNMYL